MRSLVPREQGRWITCFVMIDIDHFKNVNDTYGHLTGDQVIQGLVDWYADRFRQTDSVGRYGGEEFAVVMPNCPIENAIDILFGT